MAKKHVIKSAFVALACTLALLGCALTGCAPTGCTPTGCTPNATTNSQAAQSESSSSVEPAQPELADCPVARDTTFGGIYLDISIDEFDKLGFSLGDSVNVKFSNGYELQNVPYLNGYNVRAGDPLVIGNPNDSRIKIALNYIDTLWDTAGVTEGDTATVTLAEKGAFRHIQDLLSDRESDERSDYDSDEQFANFRSLKGGALRQGTVYRSSSPINNKHNRAPYVNKLMEQAGIAFVLDLSYKADEIEKVIAENSQQGADISYIARMQSEGRVDAIGLSVNYLSQPFVEKLASGLIDMMQHDGPYLINCSKGKDRTGFACALLEGLCGATYDEIVADYMLTYENYYGITKEGSPEKCETIMYLNLDDMLEYLAHAEDGADLSKVDFAPYAREYLKNGGMTDEQIDALVARITQ